MICLERHLITFLKSQSSWIVGMVFFIPVRVGLTGFFSIMWVFSLVFCLLGWIFTPVERLAHRRFFHHLNVLVILCR